jgi:hypothetical protein
MSRKIILPLLAEQACRVEEAKKQLELTTPDFRRTIGAVQITDFNMSYAAEKKYLAWII